MDTLKTQILELRDKGLRQYQIAEQLNCSTGTVSYHCNPNTKKKALDRKQLNRKSKILPLHIHAGKEISVQIKQVCWKHAEAICVARLIELGYEVFTPFNGGGEIDLVAMKDKQLFKIQVKSVSPTNNEKIVISTVRTVVNYKSSKTSPYENIDFYLIYDGTNVYKINNTETIKHITLRYSLPTNRQVEHICMAKDYIF